jgi:hypothetical protein
MAGIPGSRCFIARVLSVFRSSIGVLRNYAPWSGNCSGNRHWRGVHWAGNCRVQILRLGFVIRARALSAFRCFLAWLCTRSPGLRGFARRSSACSRIAFGL